MRIQSHFLLMLFAIAIVFTYFAALADLPGKGLSMPSEEAWDLVDTDERLEPWDRGSSSTFASVWQKNNF